MKNFLKMTLATLTGLLLFAIVSIFILSGIIGTALSFGETQPIVPREGVLTMDMSKITLTEQTQEMDPVAMLQGGGIEIQPIGIYSAIKSINIAAQDPSIKMIYLKPDGLSGGLSHIEELRTALEKFRNSGKAVVSFIENPTNAGYYLASVSDKIYMTSYEGGTSMLNGLSSQMVFLKDLLDNIGVNVQLIRHGKYKSAGEMYIRNSPSEENLEQNKEMIESIWNSMAAKMASSRDISLETFNSIIDNLQLNSPTDFLQHKLVDELVTREEMRKALATLCMVENPDDIESISLIDYSKARAINNLNSKGKVAIIYANGNIIDGDDYTDVAGDRFAKIIADIRKDESINAAVLRVNSPGGSVLASEKIQKEIELLKKEIPVIASYGDYAASGGYWISAGCDRVFSNATTLTGSIGVFSMLPDISETMKEKLHVNITHINSNKHSDLFSMMRPLDQAEVAYMQASVENIYGMFTSIVSEGRKMPVERVDEIAQGRVWSGTDALEINLVDQIGTLEDAIGYAAMSIEGVESISDVEVVEYPKPLTNIELLLQSIEGSKEEILAGTPFGGVERAFRDWNESQTGKVYARMPYEYFIR